MVCVVDLDWKTVEYIRVNGGAGDAKLIRQALDHQACEAILTEARPEDLLGNACCKVDDRGCGGVTAHKADTIVQISISSRAQILVMECPVGFAGTDTWKNKVNPQLHMAGCETETASLSATAVGVPTTKRRVFVVAIKKQGDNNLRSKLVRWKGNVERRAPSTLTVGDFLGCLLYTSDAPTKA